jgi:CheY-like chemotaxis protein
LTLTTGNCHLDAQYAAAHPTVTPGDYASISVTDTGVGMTPDVLAKIFDPFFSTKAPGHGTGLGLSMVFGFATQSGGHVTAYSEPGVGTTIRLYLPRAIASDVQVAVVPRNTEPTPVGGGETILVVEDNDALRGVVTQQLEELGYRVLEASSATAALALLAEAPADLVFSDLVMAGDMDGFDLAARVRANWPDVPIVLTTGFAGAREGERLTGSLASVLVLHKPYDLGALARTMRDALQKVVE